MPAARKPSRKNTATGSPSTSTTPLTTAEQWTEPPFSGFIETTEDALLILEAARRRLIPRVTRRLSDRERKLIASGSVFVFEEEESGIKRWTDSLVWSPSRILGNFLIYRETDKRNADGSSATRPGHRTNGSISGPSSLLVAEPEPSNYSPSSPTSASWNASLSRPRGPKSSEASLSGEAGSSGLDRARERVLLGSLTNSTKFKDDGMMKKTFSLTLPGTNKTHHLVSYYKVSDVEAGRLRTPSSLPELAALDISPDFLERTHFRVPPRVEVGEDGRVRYRGEPLDDYDPESPPSQYQSLDSVPPSSSSSVTAISSSRSPSYGHSNGYRQTTVEYSTLNSPVQAQGYLNQQNLALDVAGLENPSFYPQTFSPASNSYNNYLSPTTSAYDQQASSSSTVYGYPPAQSYPSSNYDDGVSFSPASLSRGNSMNSSGEDLSGADSASVMGVSASAGPISMTHQSLAHHHRHGHTSVSVSSTVASSMSEGSTLISSNGSGSTSPGQADSRRSSVSAVCSPMVLSGIKNEPNDVEGMDVDMGMMMGMDGITTLNKGWQNGNYGYAGSTTSGYDAMSVASSASANSYSIPPPQVMRQQSHHQQQQQSYSHHHQISVKTNGPSYGSSMVTSPSSSLIPAIPPQQNYFAPSQSHPVYSAYHSSASYFTPAASSNQTSSMSVQQPYTEHSAMTSSSGSRMYSPDNGSAASQSSNSNGGSLMGSPMSSEGGYTHGHGHHARNGSMGGMGRGAQVALMGMMPEDVSRVY